jgi:hypothetical protein
MRFFFDYKSEKQAVLDYSGYDFKCSRAAIEFAHETLLLLKNSLNREWDGWSIEVCSIDGAKLCKLPIDAPQMRPLSEYEQGIIGSVS